MDNFFVSTIWRAEKPIDGLWALIISGVPLIGFYLLEDEVSVVLFGIIVGFCWPPTQ